MRCSPLATDPGDSTWTTRSTAPMSMPSSREDVATIAARRPSFSASSTSVRCSRASEPWCARTRSSSASSFKRAARRSAMRRAFTNTIVERCARISSSSCGWIDGQIEARSGRRVGSSTGRVDRLAELGHVLDRDDHLDLHRLAVAGVDDRHGPRRRRSSGRRGSARSPRAGAAWPTARCVAGACRSAAPGARARARGARRASWRPARGSRRR